MKRTDSGKLISHIEEAEDWLNKAKNEYTQANPTRGEMILNLAQAEVKHAWELSRGRFVTNNNCKINNRSPRVYLLPAAASIILLLSIMFGTQLGKITNNRQPQLAANPKPRQAVKETHGTPFNLSPAKLISKQLPAKNTVLSKPSTHPETLVAENTVVPETKTVIAKSSPEPVVVTVTPKKEESRTETTVQPEQPRVHPVTQMLIDEEALTKEASRSLRNGQ